MNEAQSDQERHHIRKLFLSALVVAAVVSVLLSVPTYWLLGDAAHHWLPLFAAILVSQFIVIYFVTIFVSILGTLPGRKRYLSRILSEKYAGQFPRAAFEYRSRTNLFGWPLLHVRIGDRFDVIRPPVKAWIAVGSSHAVGLIFASGGLAIAPISFGGVAVGLVSFGAMAFGMLSIGAGSFGIWAYGGMAFGWQIFCGCGMAWHSATGGVVAARDFALGGFAHAAQANTDAAKGFFQQDFFSRVSNIVANHGFFLMLLWVVPVTLQARIIGRARRQRELANA